MYISYDLAKAIQRDRLVRSMAEAERRRNKQDPKPLAHQTPQESAVVELVFRSHCDTDQIGA